MRISASAFSGLWAAWLLAAPSGLTAQAPTPSFAPARVGILADQGRGQAAHAVLSLLREQGVDLVLHQGDLDYADDPTRWMAQVDRSLGADVPYLVSVGNHDVQAWPGYRAALASRLAATPGLMCAGVLGVNTRCRFRSLTIVLSGVGTLGQGHARFARAALEDAPGWRLCSWHKNQRLLQTERKQDETGYAIYEACRAAGALILTGHAHVYARTGLLSSTSPPTLASAPARGRGADAEAASDGELASLFLRPGYTVVVVAGIGGRSIRRSTPALAALPWWAVVHDATTDAVPGALICDFGVRRAECRFIGIDQRVVDRFELVRSP